MTVKNLFLFLILCCVSIIFGSDCNAQTLTSLDLLNNAKEYDNKTIVYEGEIMGDIMIRADHAWLNVNDGIIAIGIWAPKKMIENIHYTGDYRQKGDIVEVTGTFHRACSEHGGDLDIHASAIKKLALGSQVIQSVSRNKIRIGAYSLILVLLPLVLNRLFL